jgi:hypothetical protein
MDGLAPPVLRTAGGALRYALIKFYVGLLPRMSPKGREVYLGHIGFYFIFCSKIER